ncbi:hypothetical protein D9757_014503 [Collybiopsis confluens]|uniref:Ubiquitin-like protease family profile domain-containing protein n=1 Tax=Collybiopsis confluens TaxID=2823264 RepID=A0A8H5G5X5_9AGAR|nr:hypothetical protein D9757_014503 [Collybiopsis confluens]
MLGRHQNCALVHCDIFGNTHSCILAALNQLSKLITQSSLSGLSINFLGFFDGTEMDINVCFPLHMSNSTIETYGMLQKRLRVVSAMLAHFNEAHHHLGECLQSHPSPLNQSVTAILFNLNRLHKRLLRGQVAARDSLYAILDASPKDSQEILQSLMDYGPRVMQSCMTPKGFITIGAGKWLNDEIINYFVSKWCTKSQATLGLSSFFAPRFLFQDTSCLCARNVEEISMEDECMILRWCSKAEQTQMVAKCWDKIFIPINEDDCHWFSASINFHLKRIDIYDSLRKVYESNNRKPICQRKNTNTILILMWLAEFLGRMKGQDVQLRDNPSSEWCFDPHAKVPFQLNSFDCGVHTLWHLQHVMQFGLVQDNCELSGAHFNDNMVGKRVRLAQEVLDNCGIVFERSKVVP